ncbi:MAG: acyl-CoA thioesterase [Thainema sp.]
MPKDKSASKGKSASKDKSVKPDKLVAATSEPTWFHYPIQVHPHHTDYAGVVWHGTYVQWLEEARIAYLKTSGLSYKDVLEMGCELPVVDLSLRYHQWMVMGSEAIVKTRMLPRQGVRLVWDFQIQSPDEEILYVTAEVSLVPLDPNTRKVLRRLPPALQQALDTHAQ